MTFFNDLWIAQGIQNSHVAVERWNKSESAAFRELFFFRYPEADKDMLIGDFLPNTDCRGGRIENSWKVQAMLEELGKPLVVSLPEDSEYVYEFRNGRDLEIVLGESPGFIHWVTNRDCSFMIAMCEDDQLIWTKNLDARMSALIESQDETKVDNDSSSATT